MENSSEISPNPAMQIAGDRTCNDWEILRDSLEKNPNNWSDAYKDFFLERLTTRYFAPIKILQEQGGNSGVGFSIVSIQCALIEFLQTARDGTNFRDKGGRYQQKSCKGNCKHSGIDSCIEHGVGVYGTGYSKLIFSRFLSQQPPFSKYFCSGTGTKIVCPDDFYFKVRCSLLHEARTTGSWRITANSERSETISVEDSVTYLQRDLFQKDLEAYVWRYKVDLLSDVELQKAFIRKFNSLCV